MEATAIIRHILPKELADYFELIEMNVEGNQLIIYLDEKNLPPQDHVGKKLESKGFYDPIRIQDFPIRDKPVILVIRKRKWRDPLTGATYSTHWKLMAKGTSFTKEFATFLKEMVGQLPG